MNWTELHALSQQYIMHTHPRVPVCLDHGEGATLYDLEGRTYIDFAGGVSGNSLGSGNGLWTDAVLEQALKLAQSPNLFYTQPQASLASVLCERCGMQGALFTASGSEGNEAMMKLARTYSHRRYGDGRRTIVTLCNAHHGNSLSMMAATKGEAYPQLFSGSEGFRQVAADIDLLRQEGKQGDVCALLLELIQVEGTLVPWPRSFVHALAVLCAEQDWLLLIDEVQTGVGRCGSLFAFQQYGILPDAVSFGGGIAGGLPLGGMLCNNRCREVLAEGTHQSTFGGNPICAAAALAVLDQLNENTLAQIREKGDYLRSGIEALGLPILGEAQGAGLMVGVATSGPQSPRILAELLSTRGLLCLSYPAGLLFMPPLLITKDELDRGLVLLREILGAGGS